MAERMLGVLAARGSEQVLLVHGDDGLDELTTTTTSTVLELEDGAVRTWILDPADVGLPLAKPEDLRGGDAGDQRGRSHERCSAESGDPHATSSC